jgi:hypothetical protein
VYPVLYDACSHKNTSVHDIAEAEWVVEFRFRLKGVLREQCVLAARLSRVSLDNEKDIAI